MENKTIFPIDEFVVNYKDNNFILMSTTAEGYTYCYDVKEIPSSARVGDIITQYSNQITKSSAYQVTKKSTQPQKRLEQVVIQNNEIGFVFNGKFSKDNYLTYITQKLANACGIKKIQNIKITKYVVAEIFNHTVCLFNINNFNDQKYVADIELEANATFGDIYYYLNINTISGFVYDELAHFQLTASYSGLFSKLKSEALQNNDNSLFPVDRQNLQELDKTNTKLFNKNFKFDFVDSWQIDDTIKQEDGNKFILLNDSDEQKIVHEKDLPKYAREGDFIGLTKDGKYEFDKPSFLKYLQEINDMVYGERL